MVHSLIQQLQRVEKLLRSQQEVLNVDDLAVMMGCSTSFIYKQSMAKKLPHYKINAGANRLYFKRTEIEEYLTKYKVKTSEELEQETTNYFIKKTHKNVKR
jgi:excisionase family DNA binding protein